MSRTQCSLDCLNQLASNTMMVDTGVDNQLT